MLTFFETTSDKNTLCKYLIKEKKYVQLISQVTTDYKSQIDHIYTTINGRIINSGVLESYFSDHKPIFSCHSFNILVMNKYKTKTNS